MVSSKNVKASQKRSFVAFGEIFITGSLWYSWLSKPNKSISPPLYLLRMKALWRIFPFSFLSGVVPSILIHSWIPKKREVFFNWTDTKGSSMYNIKYNVYDEEGVPIEKIISTSKREVKIKGLVPSTNYQFYLKSQSDGLYPKQPSVSVKTKGDRKYWLNLKVFWYICLMQVSHWPLEIPSPPPAGTPWLFRAFLCPGVGLLIWVLSGRSFCKMSWLLIYD